MLYSQPSSTILEKQWLYLNLLNRNPAAQYLPCFCCFANQNTYGGYSFIFISGSARALLMMVKVSLEEVHALMYCLYLFYYNLMMTDLRYCIQIIRCSSRSCVLALIYKGWLFTKKFGQIRTKFLAKTKKLYFGHFTYILNKCAENTNIMFLKIIYCRIGCWNQNNIFLWEKATFQDKLLCQQPHPKHYYSVYTS